MKIKKQTIKQLRKIHEMVASMTPPLDTAHEATARWRDGAKALVALSTDMIVDFREKSAKRAGRAGKK